MADAKRGKDGRLGPYRLGRRHGSKDSEMEDLGQLYEAHNEHTDSPALVLVPGPDECGMPEEDWTVRVTTQARPPFLALEVVRAPATGGMAALAGLFELLTRMMERMDWGEEARRHLTRQPERRLKRWAKGARRVLGKGMEYRVELLAVALVLLLGVAHWRAVLKLQRHEQQEASGVTVQQTADASHAPLLLVDAGDEGAAGITYPLPAKPFIDQAKAPCRPKRHEVEINGGCWLELALRPPCGEDYAEYQGKCYAPVAARSRKPQAIQP
jgi:hypothetical protein